MIHLHLVFHGRVQGVGFRAFVLHHARELGAHGRVWNRADAAVEVAAEGEKRMLEALTEALREGPPAARVTRLETQWAEGEPRYRDFSVATTERR